MRRAFIVAGPLCALAVLASGTAHAQIVMGTGPGSPPVVRVITSSDDFTFEPYGPAFGGGVNVAMGDVDGDGVADIITGAGPGGGPHVVVFSGQDRSVLASFFAYDPAFAGGVNVAAGDVDGDGLADIITGAGAGGSPHVQVFSGRDLSVLASFFAYNPGFGGGVYVAAGDVDGDGVAEVITGAGAGGGPHVQVIKALELSVLASFFAYDPAFGGGVTVAAGDLNGDGRSDLITGAGPGGGPHVVVYSGLDLSYLASFYAYDPAFGGGVYVAAGDIDGDGRTDLITGAGPGGGPHVRVFSGVDLHEIDSFLASATGNGVSVGSVGDWRGLTFTSATSATFQEGLPGTFTVTTAGNPVPAITSSGALPGGVTLTDNGDGTATLAGTPAAGSGGTYLLTFTADNGTATPATQTFTLTVHEAPAITSAAAATFPIGAPGTFTVTTTGFPVPTIAVGGAALPAGVSFVDTGTGTGTLSGTPAAGTDGTYALTFTATNGSGFAVQNFTLTVSGSPAITSAGTTTFTVGSAGTFTVTAVGSPTPTISVGGTLPAGVTFVDNGNGNGTLSGTPAAGTGGAYAITFTAANGVPPNGVQAFTLNVQQPPAITSATSTTFTVGTPGTFTVTTTGFPTPTVSQSGTLPTGVTFTAATRILAGTATQIGTFALVFTAANGVPPDAAQNFTVNVVCPAITITPLVMAEGLYQAAYAGVDFNQTGSTGSSFTWGATGLPAGLTIDPTTGIVSGTPTNTVLNGAVVVTVTDNFGCPGTLNTTITVRPTTDNESYTGGVGHTQFIVAAAGVATPHVLVNDNVKTGDNGPGALTVTFPASSANGSIVEGTTDGTFVYTPNLNFGGPSDSFTYTLTDGNGVTNTGTVTIALSGIVWYVNSSAGAGDGRSHNPFNTLTAAGTASSAGSIIYVHTGGATTTGNLTMDASQSLFGQGAVFTLNGLTIASGARPTLTGTVTLANNDTVTAVNFAPSGIPAMAATGVTGPIGIDQVNVTGGTNALSLANVSGAVAVTNATFTNTSAAEVLINQGTGNVSIAATISSNAGRSIDIQNRTGGTVTFSGPITDTGQGVFLNANTGSTINFTGGLSLTTGTNPGLTATGGGTVTATQNNTTIINTITTTTGTALNATNTTIGASGLTFRSISANGAASGIVLDNTGASGGLTVIGDGTNTAVGGNGSGGTISNATGADNAIAGSAIYLNNTRNVSLSRMTIDGTNQNYGIRGTLVNGFTLQYSTVGGANGTAASLPSPENYGEGSVHFGNATTNGVVGTVTFTNNNISGGRTRNISIVNTAAGTTTLTVKGNTFGLTQNFSDGNASLAVEARVSSGVIINSTVGGPLAGEGNTFAGQAGDGANFTGQQNTTMDVVFRNNTISNSHAQNIIGGGSLNLSTAGTMTFNVDGNTMRDANGSSVTLFKAQPLPGSATPSLSGRFTNNTIGVAAVTDSGSKTGNGIFISAGGTGTMSFTIQNNVIHQIRGNAHIFADNTGGSYTANFTITGNTLGTPGAGWFAGIAITNGSATSSDTINVCAKIGGSTAAEKNRLNFALPNNLGIIVGASGAAVGHTFNLPGLAGGATEANIESFLLANNTFDPGFSFTVDAFVDAPATFAAFTGVGTTCSTP